jgi:hypothetical protein
VRAAILVASARSRALGELVSTNAPTIRTWGVAADVPIGSAERRTSDRNAWAYLPPRLPKRNLADGGLTGSTFAPELLTDC